MRSKFLVTSHGDKSTYSSYGVHAGTREGLCSAEWLLRIGISLRDAWGPWMTGPVSWGGQEASSVVFPPNSDVKTITLLHHYRGGRCHADENARF